jgi:membrane protein YqaA with SNARE-associated domain|tara:strand:+ start:30 stop:629 length:600 start_codon:yes stop_codon:yes gene_type:complete
MKSKPKQEIVLVLAVGIALAIILNVVYDYEPFSFQFIQEITNVELDLIIPDDNFIRFALAVQFGYDMLPTLAQQFTISAITVQLLMTGFSPLIIAIISAIGLLLGQMILYVVGMFVRKVHKGSFGDIAGHNHFLHKYHFLVYFSIPFVGILGDAGMVYSGHQRINPLKIIPFLFVADLASTCRWLLPTLAELEITEIVK